MLFLKSYLKKDTISNLGMAELNATVYLDIAGNYK